LPAGIGQGIVIVTIWRRRLACSYWNPVFLPRRSSTPLHARAALRAGTFLTAATAVVMGGTGRWPRCRGGDERLARPIKQRGIIACSGAGSRRAKEAVRRRRAAHAGS